ncbi:hypothetical protein NPIL_241171 [Nephila pilipes]|uniref:Uncharacterized protein n=1 Tax=Nephila pilipes TaxID=299642 RepID=A0A8X6QYC8_NEPPI|nr:hypothetical protein NPIL_241171 [Nephila pilipes]
MKHSIFYKRPKAMDRTFIQARCSLSVFGRFSFVTQGLELYHNAGKCGHSTLWPFLFIEPPKDEVISNAFSTQVKSMLAWRKDIIELQLCSRYCVST